MVSPLVSAAAVAKSYRRGNETVHALRGVDLDVAPGQITAIRGESGSGKTTLLALLCGWETPDQGRIARAGGTDWCDIALIPQSLGLLDDLTIGENILLPTRLQRQRTLQEPSDVDEHADTLMRRLGLAELIDRHPNQTSLGEQQRAAVARALVLRPPLVLADEPTAHQDHGWADAVLAVMREHARHGAAFVLVSHHAQAWDAADRLLTMADGALS